MVSEKKWFKKLFKINREFYVIQSFKIFFFSQKFSSVLVQLVSNTTHRFFEWSEQHKFIARKMV